MNSEEKVEEMMMDISLLNLALGQVIYNSMRNWKDDVKFPEVALMWIAKYPAMGIDEWLVGTSALVHYFECIASKSAINAAEILRSPKNDDIEFAKLLIGINPRKVTKNKSDAVLSRSLHLIKMMYQWQDCKDEA